MITFKSYLDEMSRDQFKTMSKTQYVVIDSDNKPHYKTSDLKSAQKIAVQKGMKIVKHEITHHAKELFAESKYDDEGMLKSMTPERAVKVLDRTRKSIASHVGRGGSAMNWRGSELRMRYDDHRSWLRVKHPKVWEKYCKDRGSHPDHDGLDMFA